MDTDLVSIFKYWRQFGTELAKKCEVFNVSPLSVLEVFPKVLLRDFALQNVDGKK